MDVRGDLKIAMRGLRRQAGLAATILFTLALGIGATTAVFSVVNAVILAPLPYAEPQRLVRVHSAFPAMKLNRFALSPPEFVDVTLGMGASLARTRFLMTLLAAFAGLALVLAAVGIYGLLSHVVAQRTNEIGLRMALGANRGQILRDVVGYGLGLVGAGVLVGLLGALALSRLMGNLVFGIGATDPLTFAAVAFILLAVSLVACLLPAGRAVRVDPVVALRYE